MEIKNKLDKPYTEKQRINFIVEQNHRQCYEIRETELALEAWGYTSEEIEEQEQQRRNSEIDNKIKELYELSIPDVLKGNTENIKIYREVIESLKESKN